METMKKLTSAMLAGVLAAGLSLPAWAASNQNFSDDMKFQEPAKITADQGAASLERKLDSQEIHLVMPIRISTICIPKGL